MSIQDFAAVGEIIGAVAVVISLVYLAIQIRQNTTQIGENTNAVRAAAIHASLNFALQNRAATFSDEGTATIYHKGLNDPESLNEIEAIRFRLMVANVFDAIFNMYSQTKVTEFSLETWQAQSNLVKRILSTDGGAWFWKSYRQEYTEAFQDEIDNIIKRSA